MKAFADCYTVEDWLEYYDGEPMKDVREMRDTFYTVPPSVAWEKAPLQAVKTILKEN